MQYLEIEMLRETEEINSQIEANFHTSIIMFDQLIFTVSNQLRPWEQSPRFHIELIYKIRLKPTSSSDYPPFPLDSSITVFKDSIIS